jgi:phosphoketolase
VPTPARAPKPSSGSRADVDRAHPSSAQRRNLDSAKQRGSFASTLELAIRNEIDGFTLAIDVIDRVPRLRSIGAHAKERFRKRQYAAKLYAHEHGVDSPTWSTGAGGGG